MGGNVFVVAAPSGAGKTSLVNALVENVAEAALSVSHTTRAPRKGEIDGRHYHFTPKEAFEAMVANGEFVEHACVFGNYYGTSRREVDRIIGQDQELILEIDWQGAEQIKQCIPDAIGIFILPPSIATLRERLNGRGQDAPEVIAKRLAQARSDLQHHQSFDYLVVNDVFDRALADLVALVRTARLRASRQKERLSSLLKDLTE